MALRVRFANIHIVQKLEVKRSDEDADFARIALHTLELVELTILDRATRTTSRSRLRKPIGILFMWPSVRPIELGRPSDRSIGHATIQG